MRLGHARLAAALLGTLVSPALAQPGTLDGSFGSGGIALGTSSSLARDVALDAAGRIVFVGSQASAGVPAGVLVGRLLADGSRDASFAGDGARMVALGCPSFPRSILEAVDVAAGGAIVAAGTSGCRRGLVVRLRDEGSPDPSFGANGVFHYLPDTASRSSAFFGMDVAPDGTVVAVGREERDDRDGEVRTYLVAVRLTPQGVLDTSFGEGGAVRLRVSDDLLPDSQLNDLVIYPDGRVLATGHVSIGGQHQTVVVRLNPDGTPDATFEGGGLVVHDLGAGASDLANALLYGPDGAIYIGGTLLRGGTFAFFGARLMFDGTRDPNYGTAGVAVVQAVAGGSCVARDVVLDLQQRLALVGDCAQAAGQTWALARLLPDGQLDAAFGDSGVASPTAPGNESTLYGVVRQGDGRLVAAGSAVVSGVPVWAVARVMDGSPTAAAMAPAPATTLTVTPNPASSLARVRFDAASAGETELVLYDALGRTAVREALGSLPAGTHEWDLEVSGLSPGVYVLHLRAGAQTATRRISVR